jgi:adenylylsulfate kinase
MVSPPSPPTPTPPPAFSGGAVLWFTGLSGAGKSTIATAVDARLRETNPRVELLDGDALRAVVPAGFSKEEREAHVRRVGFFASRLEHHGVIVIAALISPYQASRNFVRSLCRRFVEIHVATSLEECERRDVKGLYARARSGELRGFTGIDDPYEPPDNPEIRIDTQLRSIAESVSLVLEHLAATPARGGK